MWIPFAVLGAVVVVVGVYFMRWRARWAPQLRVLKSGDVAEATVLDRNELETSSTGGSRTGRRLLYFGSLVLEVRREGQEPYKAQCKQWFDQGTWSFVGEKAIVPVRIDRADRKVVFVDTEAKLKQLQDASDSERERHAKRQDELMKS
jgi:hypothetical protein